MEQSLTIATFNERAPADRLTTRLREAGFNADLFDESAAQKWFLLNLKPRAHMRVRVPKDDGDRAIQQLKEWDAADGAMKDAVHCPQCNSSRIEYPQFSRRTLMSAFPAAAAAAGIIERQFYCEACGFTWEAEPKPPRKMDVLNWPEGTQVP
jgi:DNA-directed RNA polymerase subunit M/transcription elongation factor TFIIS